MKRGKFRSFIRWIWHALIGRFDNLSKLTLDLETIKSHAEVRAQSFPEPPSQLPKRGIYLYEGNDPPILFARGNINMFLPNFHFIELGEMPVIQPTRLRKYGPFFVAAIAMANLFFPEDRPSEWALVFTGFSFIVIPSLLLNLFFMRLVESWFIEQTFYIPR